MEDADDKAGRLEGDFFCLFVKKLCALHLCVLLSSMGNFYVHHARAPVAPAVCS